MRVSERERESEKERIVAVGNHLCRFGFVLRGLVFFFVVLGATLREKGRQGVVVRKC